MFVNTGKTKVTTTDYYAEAMLNCCQVSLCILAFFHKVNVAAPHGNPETAAPKQVLSTSTPFESSRAGKAEVNLPWEERNLSKPLREASQSVSEFFLLLSH